MKRRDVLRSSAAALALSTAAGCTEHHLQEAERAPPPGELVPNEEVDLPVPQRLDIAADGIERSRDAEIRELADLGTYLGEVGIHVAALDAIVEEGTPIISLDSVSEPTTETGLMHHLGQVAGAYAVLVESMAEPEKLEVHLLDRTGDEFGEYEVRRTWAEKYAAREYSARKYASEVAVTAEST